MYDASVYMFQMMTMNLKAVRTCGLTTFLNLRLHVILGFCKHFDNFGLDISKVKRQTGNTVDALNAATHLLMTLMLVQQLTVGAGN